MVNTVLRAQQVLRSAKPLRFRHHPASLAECRFGVVTAWEVSMDPETSNPESETRIDTIGWLFAIVFVVITAAASVVAYNANDLTITKPPVAVAAR